MARLLAIARRSASRAPMEELEQATLSTEHGVAGDFRGRPGPRQVTVVSREAWERACRELGEDIPWTTRRANLLVEGLELAETAGQELHVGSVVLAIAGEVDPCWRMEEARPGLRAALTPEWRGGVSCRIVHGGIIKKGQSLELALAHADQHRGAS